SDYDVNLDPTGYRTAKAQFDADHAKLLDPLRKYEREELPQKLDAFLANRPQSPLAKWLLPEVVSFASQGGATITWQDDGSLLVGGKNPPQETLTIHLKTPLAGITALRLEALAHPSLVKGGPGRAANGNFALTTIRVTATPLNKSGAAPVSVK